LGFGIWDLGFGIRDSQKRREGQREKMVGVRSVTGCAKSLQ